MTTLAQFVALFIWMGFWAVQAGRSMPKKWTAWQDKANWLSSVPEFILALSIGLSAAIGWGDKFDLSWLAKGMG